MSARKADAAEMAVTAQGPPPSPECAARSCVSSCLRLTASALSPSGHAEWAAWLPLRRCAPEPSWLRTSEISGNEWPAVRRRSDIWGSGRRRPSGLELHHRRAHGLGTKILAGLPRLVDP
eukprot:8654000-Pyramimonas_sp.AAC.1